MTMTAETKWLGVILIATVVLLFGGVFLLSRGGSSKDIAGVNVSQIDYAKGQKIGSDSAKVKLVEFSDFQCPACQAAEPALKQVLSKYPNDLQFIYRHFPLPQHAYGRQAASYAEAAGEQGKFWEMHDKLFETQTEWSALGDSDATTFFLRIAKELGLDENKIKQSLAENTFKSKIDSDIAEAQSLGVNSTPTFFVNGRKLNLQSFDDLNATVAEELKK